MITLSKLTRADVPRMMFWGKHYDPRFYHYNFDITTERGFDMWLKSKKKLFYRRIYKVEKDQQLVGFITIKNIKWSTKEAEMGIVFDPDELSKGYGKAGIKLIFKEFFEEMKMNRLYLRVASFNKRAFHAYLHAGFKTVECISEPFESQQLKELLVKKYDDFVMLEEILYMEYIYMEMTKNTYFNDVLKINE